MDKANLKADTIPLFLSFCIEQYKNAKGISGKEAIEILDDAGALAYLEQNYEPIHTQSPQWILQEVTNFVNSHK
jgi:hypothetical protein